MSEFEKAFAQARAAGKPLFCWQGKQYTTVRADGKPLPVVSEVKRYPMFGAPGVMTVMATDFDTEHALRIEAERQVGELRRWQETVCDASELLRQLDELQAKLDTAMGLLRILSSEDATLWQVQQAMDKCDSLFNTTSTEGKDHE